MKEQISAPEMLKIIFSRIVKDIQANEAMCNPKARKLARVTLTSLAHNIALELEPWSKELGFQLQSFICLE